MLNRSGSRIIYTYIILVIAFLALVAGCLSCNTAKQATKHYNKAKEKNIVTVAQLVRTDWPCVTSKVDTIKGKDSIIINEKIVPQYVTITDTLIQDGKPVYITKTKYVDCNCKDSVVYRPQYITKMVEDSAKIYVAIADRDKALMDVDKYKGWAHTKGVVIWVLIGLIAGYILLTKTFKLF